MDKMDTGDAASFENIPSFSSKDEEIAFWKSKALSAKKGYWK